MKIITTIAAFIAIVASSAAVTATAQTVSTDVRISYADLNLSSPAGQAAMTRRIENAARRACAVNSAQRDQAMQAETSRCFDAAVAGARTSIAMATAPVFASR